MIHVNKRLLVVDLTNVSILHVFVRYIYNELACDRVVVSSIFEKGVVGLDWEMAFPWPSYKYPC